MHRLLLVSSFLSILLFSCKLFPVKENNKQETIARVYDKYLYKDELKNLIPKGTGANDSIEITTAYINNWVRQELLLKQAEDNLDESNRDFSKQIEQYRNSLIIYTYESELVKQKLDTVVQISEIESYYNENQNNFHLRENIVLSRYFILNKESALVTKKKSYMQSNR